MTNVGRNKLIKVANNVNTFYHRILVSLSYLHLSICFKGFQCLNVICNQHHLLNQKYLSCFTKPGVGTSSLQISAFLLNKHFVTCCGYNPLRLLAPVVRKVDSAFHWINYYPLESAIGFRNTVIL